MAIKSKGAKLYHDGDLAAAPAGVPHVRAELPGPNMTNLEIEDPARRAKLKPEEGDICVSVMPGDDRIGDVRVNLQFEGKKGAHDLCMLGHNDLLEQTSGILKELFDDLGGEWEVTLGSKPCPAAKVPVRLEVAAVALERGVSAAQTIKQQVSPTVAREHKVEARHDRGGRRGG
jgi:hypothetical protein